MKSLFGYIIVNKPEMKFKEFDLYHAYYCGLRRSLKKCYGMACVCSGKSRIKKTKKPGNAAANRLSGLCRGG